MHGGTYFLYSNDGRIMSGSFFWFLGCLGSLRRKGLVVSLGFLVFLGFSNVAGHSMYYSILLLFCILLDNHI